MKMMSISKRALTVATAAITSVTMIGLAGCSSDQKADSPKQSDSGKSMEKPLVLTTFTVLRDMAQNVAGDNLDVQSITAPDEEIHDFQPSPDDVKKATKAKLVLNNGLGLERWFDKFTEQSGAKSVVVSEGVTPIPIAEGDYQGKPNPHAWMSPKAGIKYVDNIAKAFQELDPEHKDDYAKNAEAYKAKISDVDKKMETELAKVPENQRALVTCEGAFSYLARDAKLTEKYLWGVNAEGALTPKRMADVQDYVKQNKVPAVFCESTVGDKMKPVVEATGAKFGGVLYVDSLTKEGGDAPTYLDLLRYDANLITAGLTQK